MTYSYGVPANTRSLAPPCFGKSYDNDNRECRGCSFQTSCRDEVIKTRNSMAPTTTDYYRQFGYGGASIAPLRAPVAPAPQAMSSAAAPPPYIGFGRPSMQPPAQQYSQQLPPGYPPPPRYGDYGWLQDPLHYMMASAPTPMRPQMPGESFAERALKNAGLSMAEAFFMQAVMSVRQLVLAPKMPEQHYQQHQHHHHAPANQQELQAEQPRSVSLPVIQIMPEKPK